MPEPTSARTDRTRSPMSKTKARRQAHRESRLYRVDYPHFKIHYQVDANGYLLFREPVGFLDARRALAAWRAERVRELMGILPCTCGGHERNRDIHREHCSLFSDPSRAVWHLKR